MLDIAAELSKVLTAESPKAPEKTEQHTEHKEELTPLAIRGITDVLKEHADWLDSKGEVGIQGDLSREDLDHADLIDARLQNAILNKTSLKHADLMLADLRGASFLQANLEGANLLGTMFQQADLQAATLQGATGLLTKQFAGANLFGATLPEDVSPADGLKRVREVAAVMTGLLTATLLLNALVWLRIFTTRDAQLLRDGPALPFLGLETVLPLIPFYLFGPVLVLVLYACFHLKLQGLWDGIAQLPAVFPDGRHLDTCLPWFARWSARQHSEWLRASRSPLAFLEEGIALFLLYWVPPVTMLLFWARYLTMEDLRGSTMHVLLAAGATAAAINFPMLVGKAFGADLPRPANQKAGSRRGTRLVRTLLPAGAGLILLLLSVGTILGAPHNYGGNLQTKNSRSKTWAADVLWAAGYNPFAQLAETELSTRPFGWTGRDDELGQVKGVSLNGLKLRYIQAYGAFLAKARFWRADLRNANLAEADLREANLREANLQSTVFDRAKLARASLQEAALQYANLNRSELQGVNLTSANLYSATLMDATLDGANLYKADLRGASLDRASLKQADLREANLQNASLAMANLQEAYLTSTKFGGARMNQADLSLAILTDADLKKADLSGADLRGAILRGADLSGANLQNANLQGAVGVTASQVCASANLTQVQLDENIRQDVETLCGGHTH